MNICLIEPPKFVSLTNAVSTIAMPPIGVAYIAASLRETGHRVNVIDAAGAALDKYYQFGDIQVRGLQILEIVNRIPADVNVVGFSCMFTSHWLLVREIIKTARERFPRVVFILGGEHVTGFPQFSFEQAPIDIGVMGEGEETIVEIARRLSAGEVYEDVPGIAFRKADGLIQVNERRARIKDIDAIPVPAWDLINVEKYIEFNQPHGAARGRFMPMLATRGCPFQCTFCTSPQMWTTTWIPRSHKLVVDEMELYIKRYGVADFQFEDLTAIVRKDWILKFCDEIINRGLKLSFQLPSGTRSEAVDYEAASKMKQAGCHEFAFAPESGDPRILEVIKKKVQLPRLFDSAKQAMKAGINVGCFFIVGFPEDTLGSILMTYKAVITCALLGFTNVNINAYSPQPNTESFNKLRQEGKIPEFNDAYLMSLFTFQDYGKVKTSYNSRFADWQVTAFVLIGTALFYFFYFLRNPLRIFQMIRDVFTQKTSNRTTKVIRSLFREIGRSLKNSLANLLHSLRFPFPSHQPK